MNKLIREGRFGPPKCGKTYSVALSYPKPLLILNTDEGGMDGIDEDIRLGKITTIKQQTVWIKPEDFDNWCLKKTEELPPLCGIDFSDLFKKLMTETYQPLASDDGLRLFVKVVNSLATKGCPWKTVMVDSISGLVDTVMSSIAKTNNSTLANAMKWAPMAGGKVHQMMGVINTLPAHVMYIFHEIQKDNEKTGLTSIEPYVPSQFRGRVGSLLSQWFYQCRENGKPMIRTTDYGLIKGLGCRWPSGLPATVGPLFSDIYGKDLQ